MPDSETAPALLRIKLPQRLPATSPARSKSRPQGRPPKADLPDARELLLASARQLLATRPPSEINRLDIARLAQVDPALVRYYFGDKDRLLRETALAMLRDVRRDRAEALPAGPSFRAWLNAYVGFLTALLAQYPFLHDLIVHLITEAGVSGAPELAERLVQEPFAEVCAMLLAGERAGEIGAVNPRFFYVAMIGMCSFPMRHPALLEQLIRPSDAAQPGAAGYADFVTDLLINGVARPSRPA